MIIAHNMLAENANRQFNINIKNKRKSSEKLSSGYKINRAADDAAGLSISEKMRNLIRNTKMATENTKDGISFVQTADGAMEELHSIIKRSRELAVKAANDVNDDNDRASIQAELDQLADEVHHIVDESQFNGIKIFGKDKAVVIEDTTATPGVQSVISTEIVHVEGNAYGLGEILGKDHISSADHMEDRILFTEDGSWMSTGHYEINPYYADDYEIIKNNLGISSLDYNEVQTLPGAVKNGNSISGIDSNNKPYRVDYFNDINGNLQPRFAKYESTYAYIYSNNGGDGFPAAGNTSHYASWLDFSEVGSRYQVEDLYEQGFNVTCGHCDRFYSIIFSDGADGDTYTTNASGVRYHYEGGSYGGTKNKLIKVDISNCSTGDDIVRNIMSATQETFLTQHYTQYAQNSSEPGRLYVYDNCSYGAGSFEPVARHTDGTIASNTVVSYVGSDNIRHTSSDYDLWIQSGGVSGAGLMLVRPWITEGNLGLNRMNVMSHESATDSIGMCDTALFRVNAERSRMGAYMNRLEYTINNNENTTENLESSESNIRDTDVPKEMVNFSKHGILEQAAQAMLAQANQQNQGVLSLLQ